MNWSEASAKYPLISEQIVMQQLEYEKKQEGDLKKAFDSYATEWWNDFKQIRESHKKRLVQIFAETDDADSLYSFIHHFL